MTSVSHWQIDDIDDALAADFDGSLSGLGMELGTASFNMSDALLALPSLSSVKQEMPRDNGYSLSDTLRIISNSESGSTLLNSENSRSLVHGKKNRLPHSGDDDVSGAIKRFCVSTGREPHDTSPRHSSSAPDLRLAVYQPGGGLPGTSPSSSSSLPLHVLPASPASPPVGATGGFQYVLGAATSIATKLHEETMTYLNQGQSYEIKLKKLGDLTEMRGKMLKSIIRVGFQERRLQYMEKEQIILWTRQRMGERILETDVPLSYGVYDVVNCSSRINCCELLWDPTKETGVFVRVNCISTEFTPKKHGGEKGVPFRIIIETFSHGDGHPQKLHAASCQVKVFKPKGADRKHKTDREKMMKRPQSEQEKHQPSYDCTVFTECTAEVAFGPAISPPPVVTAVSGPSVSSTGSQQSLSSTTSTTTVVAATTGHRLSTGTPPPLPPPLPSVSGGRPSSYSPQTNDSTYGAVSIHEQNPGTPGSSTSDVLEVSDASLSSPQTFAVSSGSLLSSEASATETSQWLHQNRFGPFAQTFNSFSGVDVLRLTRDDLIQICGLADGIRLYNALHSRAVRPRLTLYICLAHEHGGDSSDRVFRAVYLENLTVMDLLSRLASVCNLSPFSVHEVYVSGPTGIHILVTDEVVRNMNDESMYILELLRAGQEEEGYSLLLKLYVNSRS
ncbi:transcription factor CP2-like isoform X3 [Ornithodoros turicata]|uniref:transcription factor CP2-like isoform X3 n=1 Tax=Ornithodoros turicata TaxID=34597 RepID=UPI003139B165